MSNMLEAAKEIGIVPHPREPGFFHMTQASMMEAKGLFEGSDDVDVGMELRNQTTLASRRIARELVRKRVIPEGDLRLLEPSAFEAALRVADRLPSARRKRNMPSLFAGALKRGQRRMRILEPLRVPGMRKGHVALKADALDVLQQARLKTETVGEAVSTTSAQVAVAAGAELPAAVPNPPRSINTLQELLPQVDLRLFHLQVKRYLAGAYDAEHAVKLIRVALARKKADGKGTEAS